MRALYSKTWQLREAALVSIEKVLKGPGVKGHKGDLFKALSRALSKTVQDKVANVFHNTVQVGRSPAPALQGRTTKLCDVVGEAAGYPNFISGRLILLHKPPKRFGGFFHCISSMINSPTQTQRKKTRFVLQGGCCLF